MCWFACLWCVLVACCARLWFCLWGAGVGVGVSVVGVVVLVVACCVWLWFCLWRGGVGVGVSVVGGVCWCVCLGVLARGVVARFCVRLCLWLGCSSGFVLLFGSVAGSVSSVSLRSASCWRVGFGARVCGWGVRVGVGAWGLVLAFVVGVFGWGWCGVCVLWFLVLARGCWCERGWCGVVGECAGVGVWGGVGFVFLACGCIARLVVSGVVCLACFAWVWV